MLDHSVNWKCSVKGRSRELYGTECIVFLEKNAIGSYRKATTREANALTFQTAYCEPVHPRDIFDVFPLDQILSFDYEES